MNQDRISSYAITIDLQDERYLLVHGLFGYVDLIKKDNYCTLNKWIQDGVKISSKEDQDFYNSLLNRKYILSQQDENEYKADLISRLKERRQKLIASPTSATIIPSYRCNFNCPYCYEKDINRDSPIMTREQVDAIIALYPENQLKHIGLYGGEPFLPEHKDIIEYIIASAPEAEYTALTNGYYLEEFVPILKRVKIRQIQVTFDGMRELHDRTRILCDGSGSFDKVLMGVLECIKNDIPIKIRMNLSKANIASCYSFKEWITQKVRNSDLLTFDMQELFQYGGETQAELTKVVIENSNVGKKNVILENMPRLARFFYNGEPIAPVISNCVSAAANRFYDPYGNIYSCFLSVGHSERTIGIFWPKCQLKESSILTRVASDIEACNKCKYLFLCGGGCPNPLFDKEGSIMQPNCINMDYAIKHLIPLVYHKVYIKR